MSQTSRTIYRISFMIQDDVYEVYARNIYVSDSEMFGFLEIEELLFDEGTNIVVDPSVERLKTEFTGVKRTYIPIHAVLRIDEVEKQGVAKIKNSELKGKVSQFPGPIYTPKNKPTGNDGD